MTASATSPDDLLRLIRVVERAKQTWQATFDAIVDPIGLVDGELRIVRGNVAYARLANADVRHINGQPCHLVLFGSASPCIDCPVGAARATSTASHSDVRQVDESGHERIFLVRAFPIASLLHNPWGESLERREDVVACQYRDVTEERLLERRLAQSEKMAAVGTLAGGVAHEINNPIGAIMAFAELGRLGSDADPSSQELFADIEEAARRCKKIVQGLLEFSRPTRLRRTLVAVTDIVDGAQLLCHHLIHRPQLDFQVHVEAGLGVMGDRTQLEQVLVNLLSNAVGAFGEPPRAGANVRLVARRDGNHVRLSVVDNGVGMSPSQLSRIFEPFYSTKPEGQGTGLGLTVSYGIVHSHGGTLEAESSPGEGSCFTVTLPFFALESRTEDSHDPTPD